MIVAPRWIATPTHPGPGSVDLPLPRTDCTHPAGSIAAVRIGHQAARGQDISAGQDAGAGRRGHQGGADERVHHGDRCHDRDLDVGSVVRPGRVSIRTGRD